MLLGRFQLDIISDGAFWLDGGAMFGVVPRVMWEKVMPPDERNRVRLGLNCLLVRTPHAKILIDTGLGDKYDARFAEIYRVERQGGILARLAELGVAPEDIDMVVNTHLHFDHAGGNTRREGDELVPTFPRAVYVIRKGEWEHANKPSERSRASYHLQDWLPLERVRLVTRDVDLAEGVRLLLTPGHLRHHQSVKIESQGKVALFLSDVIPTRHHLKLPWTMSFDLYPLETLETKRVLLEQALERNWLLFFYHDAEQAAGYLRRADGQLTLEPMPDAYDA